MTAAFLLFVTGYDPSLATIDRAVSAMRALDQGVVVAEVRDLAQPLRQDRVTLEFRKPDLARVRVDAASRLDLWVTKNEVTLADPAVLQHAVRKREPKETPADSVAHDLGGMDGWVLAMLAANPLAGLREQAKSMNERRYSFAAGRQVVRLKGATGVVHLEFHPRSGRVLLVRTAQGGATVERRFSYPQRRPALTPSPAPGSRRVAEIDPLTLPPTYADASARQATQAMFARHDRREPSTLTIATPEGEVRAWLASGAVRQRDPWVDFSYAKGRLTLVRLKDGAAWQGDAGGSEVLEAVAAAGSRVDPMLRLLLRGENPYRLLLGRRSKVRVAGSLGSGAQEALILEGDSPSLKVTLYVRKSDSRVIGLVSEPKTKEGETVPAGVRRFEYGPAPSSGDLSLSPAKVRPLAELLPKTDQLSANGSKSSAGGAD